LDKRKELGKKAFLDFRDVGDYQLLVRDVIASLYQHALPDKVLSDLSFGSYGTLIRDLLEYCRKIGLPTELRLKDLSFELLLDYRVYLKQSRSKNKAGNRRRLFGNLLRLLQAGQSVGLAHPDIIPPRNFSYVDDSDVSQPYTAGAALDLEDACRTHIRELLARLEKGKELLLLGKNPKGLKPPREPSTGRILRQAVGERAWNILPNLLWYIVNILDGKFLKRPELLAGGHSSLNNSFMGTWGGEYRKEDVYLHLYPLTEDLIPFAVLLAKKTGRNQSSIFNLKRNCLQEIDGRYFLCYEKARGSARIYRKCIDSEGQFSPVALIKTLQRITEPLVRHAAPGDKNYLFLGLTTHPHDSEPVKALDHGYTLFQMNRQGGWCEQRGLLDEHGQPLKISFRRWRIFYLTNRYKKKGQLSRISRDAAHVLGGTTVRYIANDATKHLHEQAVQAGIQCARSLAGAAVIAEDNPQSAALSLSTTTDIAEKILQGEQDVLFASCKDFYNQPGGQPNTPCGKPWLCIICPNAIITRHVLPRVLLFRDFISKQRGQLSDEDWSLKFGQAWLVLCHDILPKFSSETIAEAELLAADEILYIPLALKT
jgi:hypothetical protein